MKTALVRSFAVRHPVRAWLSIACDVVADDGSRILPRLADADVLMTPHVSDRTEGMLETRATPIAANIERTLRGEPVLNAIDLDF